MSENFRKYITELKLDSDAKKYLLEVLSSRVKPLIFNMGKDRISIGTRDKQVELKVIGYVKK